MKLIPSKVKPLKFGKVLYVINQEYLKASLIPEEVRARYLILRDMVPVTSIEKVKVIGIIKYIDGTYGYVIGKPKLPNCIYPMDYAPKWHIQHHMIDEDFICSFVFSTKEKATKHYKATRREDEIKIDKALRKYLKED